MDRQDVSAPESLVGEPGEQVRIVMTDARHIAVMTEREVAVVVRKVPYRFTAHLYLWADGQLHLGEEGAASIYQYQPYQAIYVHREDSRRDLGVSTAARAAVAEIAIAMASDWLKANPDAPRLAEIADLNMQATRLEREIAGYEAQAATARLTVNDLDRRLAGLRSVPGIRRALVAAGLR